MDEHAVVIAGGGPTGLMLAGELALAGVDVVVIERRATQDLAGSRAGGLLPRTIEVLDQRGLAERFLAQGQTSSLAAFTTPPLDLRDAATRHPYWLALWQERTERTLAAWVEELRVPIRRAVEVDGFTQDAQGVDVALSDGRPLRARWLVGCDGGRSVIRKRAGIDFPGWDASVSWLHAEVETTADPPFGLHREPRGMQGIGKLEGGRVRMVLMEPEVRRGEEPTLDDLRQALVAAFGSDFGVHSPTFLSRFSDATRQAASYRAGRVLLAGDAAHVHAPSGGQGLNLGVQDAVNLGWKLAQVVNGTSPEALLDSYHAERHPVDARTIRRTMAIGALSRGDDRTEALRDAMTDLLAADDARRRWAAAMTGLDVRYDLGAGHPLLGRRVPDVDLLVAGEPTRVFALLREARPVLLDLAGGDRDAWTGGVRVVVARCEARWELPVIGEVSAPAALLIRPDGHVAWVGDGSDHGLREALEAWCPTQPRSPPGANDQK